MKSRVILLFVAMQVVINAQTNLNYTCISLGLTRNYQAEYGNPELDQYSFYPEISFGGKLFTDRVEWKILFGYWDDGIDEPSPFMDATTITFSSYVFGVKFYYIPESEFLKISRLKSSVSAGFTYSKNRGKYLSSIYGILPDIEETKLNAYLGWYATYNIASNLFVIGEAGLLFPGKDERLGRIVGTIGLKYEFGNIF